MNTNISSAILAPEPALTSVELDRARLFLEQAQNGVLGALKGLSEAQWSFKPEPAVWSIAGNVEHIVIVQERILGPIREKLAAAPAPHPDRDYAIVDQIVINQFANRLTKFQGPESAHPKDGLALEEAGERVAANTRRLIDYLESTSDLRRHAIESAPLTAITQGQYRFMDAYQWILGAAAHTERHVKQILEVKARPDFPAN
jgi:hypothetical protein